MTYEQAMDRIRDEMATLKPGDLIAAVGEIATELLERNPDRAENVEGKTLKAAFSKIESAAKARKKGSGAVCVGPDEAARIVARYYGFEVEGTAVSASAVAPEPGTTRDALDDLMEGLL